MVYIRAEQERKFGLHLYAWKQMMPYVFADGHVNYARYGQCYINIMGKLPIAVLDLFIHGEPVANNQ